MIFYILVGLFSGILSGMGIGGGTILIPSLIFFFGVQQQIAQNINLLTFIPTAIIALIVHIRNKKVRYDVLFIIIISGLLTAYLGSAIALKLDAEILRKSFGCFLFVIGILEFFKGLKIKRGDEIGK